MMRERLVQELREYRCADRAEQSLRDRIYEFIKREPRCFERATAEGHMTASACITDPARTATVLVHHRRFDRWVQPGGHADGDGDLRAVALREAREETSLTSLVFASPAIFDIAVFDNLRAGAGGGHLHFDIRYHLHADRAERPVASSESYDAIWIDFERLDTLDLDESVLRLTRKVAGV